MSARHFLHCTVLRARDLTYEGYKTLYENTKAAAEDHIIGTDIVLAGEDLDIFEDCGAIYLPLLGIRKNIQRMVNLFASWKFKPDGLEG